MTNRERINASFAFQETDRLCFAPLCDGYFATGLPAQGHPNDLIAALKYIGCDIILRHAPCYTEHYENVQVSTTENNGVYTTSYSTPKGDVSFVYYFENGTRFLKKHLLKSVSDLEIMTYIAEHTYYEECFDQFTEFEEILGDDGVATATAPMSPLLEATQVLCGLENMSYFLYDEPDIVEAMFAAMHKRNIKVYELLKKLPSKYVFAYEDTSTTLISRDQMSKYAVPALNDYAKIMHEAGKTFITHMCGKLKGFMGEIAKVQSDGIDSVCPPTTGDVTLAQVRAALPNKVLIGGIEPPSMVLKNREALLSDIISTLNGIEDKRGIILSSGDAVPYGTSIETLRAISEMIRFLGEKSLKPGIDVGVIKHFL